MLRNFLKNRKAQNTAEYALLIALVVAGVIAMQTYAQRALQARIHDASTYMSSQTSTIGGNVQYEPYYLQSNYDVGTNSVENKRLGSGLVEADSSSNRQRAGYQASTYTENDMAGGDVDSGNGGSSSGSSSSSGAGDQNPAQNPTLPPAN